MLAETSDDAPLARAFFERDARVVARALLGTRMVVRGAVVRIVETEAYRGPTDAACHARFGETSRTRALFGPPGRAYVFLIYGMYDCFNVTCLGEGKGHAVLVRAVEPIAPPTLARTDGPGRLTRALGITRKDDGVDLVEPGGAIVLLPRGSGTPRPRVMTTARVGVAYAGDHAEAPLRFFDVASPFVSRPSAKSIGLGPSREGARVIAASGDAANAARALRPARSSRSSR